MPLLRARLVASGDLAADAAADPAAYDAALEAAVRRFQQRMGLGSDGAVGAGSEFWTKGLDEAMLTLKGKPTVACRAIGR